MTDVVRIGFTVETPQLADQIIDRLARKFEVLDEGWKINSVSFVDRKALVRFADGTVGEVQFWPPGIFEAKEFEGGRNCSTRGVACSTVTRK